MARGIVWSFVWRLGGTTVEPTVRTTAVAMPNLCSVTSSRAAGCLCVGVSATLVPRPRNVSLRMYACSRLSITASSLQCSPTVTHPSVSLCPCAKTLTNEGWPPSYPCTAVRTRPIKAVCRRRHPDTSSLVLSIQTQNDYTTWHLTKSTKLPMAMARRSSTTPLVRPMVRFWSLSMAGRQSESYGSHKSMSSRRWASASLRLTCRVCFNVVEIANTFANLLNKGTATPLHAKSPKTTPRRTSTSPCSRC